MLVTITVNNSPKLKIMYICTFCGCESGLIGLDNEATF